MGVWGSIGELGAHYMCEVRFGSVLRFQLGVQKVPLLPEMKIYVDRVQKILLPLQEPVMDKVRAAPTYRVDKDTDTQRYYQDYPFAETQ